MPLPGVTSPIRRGPTSLAPVEAINVHDLVFNTPVFGTEHVEKLRRAMAGDQLSKAGALRLMGRIEEAERLLRDSAREAATRADYSYQMGCIRADYGDIFGAIEYFERAVDMDPHHTAALFRLANEMNRLGNDS